LEWEKKENGINVFFKVWSAVQFTLCVTKTGGFNNRLVKILSMNEIEICIINIYIYIYIYFFFFFFFNRELYGDSLQWSGLV